MRAPWSRRGHRPRDGLVLEPALAERKSRWTWRTLLSSRREARPIQGPWLQLARDYLLAHGARIRAESVSHILADLPGGSQVAYTDAQGHDQNGALPLVP